MRVDHDKSLPVVRVGELARQHTAQRWLIEQLWGASSVGVIGGAPKCSKTWLGLDLALSVATGTACLGKYAVPEPGPVLVYLAEDALPVVRERVATGVALVRGSASAGVTAEQNLAGCYSVERERNGALCTEPSPTTETKTMPGVDFDGFARRLPWSKC